MSVVAQELKAHGHDLFYYDNAKKGEANYLVNNVPEMTVLPIEVKSGKDFYKENRPHPTLLFRKHSSVAMQIINPST